MLVAFFFFFFQAEDGIRDLTVTGVQTCALPISHAAARRADRRRRARGAAGTRLRPAARHGSRGSGAGADPRLVAARARGGERERAGGDRVEHSAGGGGAGAGELGGERRRRSGEAGGGWGG